MNEAGLQAALDRAGLTLSPEQRAAMLVVVPRFEAMLARNRSTPPRDRAQEPSHIFVPDRQ